MKIGYARVSGPDQSLDVQLEALEAAGCEKIYREKESGKSTDGRVELDHALDQLRAGDELVVTRLDRGFRSVADLFTTLSRIVKLGARFVCLQQPGANTEGATGKLLLGILGVVAEFERDMLRERQAEGIAKAKAKGVYRGRKAELTRDQVLEAFERHQRSAIAASKELGCSRASIYRILGPLAELGDPPCNTAIGAPINDTAV
jgi:DNA invertase Pin-like site-specific DNA recombinase